MATVLTQFTLETLQTVEGVRELNRQLNEAIQSSRRSLLPYGDSTAQSASTYLSTIDGVVMTASAGYRMHRKGSIIGHSCLLNITTATSDDVTFEARVNDTNQSAAELQFPSSLGTGVTSKSIVLARHAISFDVGDIIQVRATETGTMAWDEVIGFLEVEFDD